MNNEVINNWEEIPEWKNREIKNFANIFSKYNISEHLLDEYLSISKSYSGVPIRYSLLATKFLMHTRWQDWRRDNINSEQIKEITADLLNLEEGGRSIAANQAISLELLTKHADNLPLEDLLNNSYLNAVLGYNKISSWYTMASSVCNRINKQSNQQSDNLDIIWEACDINKISPLELENPDFIYSIDKYMNDHDLLEILSNEEISFYDPEMPEIIYNAIEPRNKKNAICRIMDTWPMDEAFLERYYSEIMEFSRYTSFIALNPPQRLSDNFLENHWNDLKKEKNLHYIFDDDRSLDFIERHFDDIKGQKQCWERIAGHCQITPDFAQKFSEDLAPCTWFLVQNPHLSSKYTDDEIYALVSPKDNSQLKEIQEAITATLRDSGLSAKDAIKVLDNIKKTSCKIFAEKNTKPANRRV